MSTTKSAAILSKNPHVSTSKRGVDAYGLYFETVEVNAGKVVWYTRVFIAGQTVCIYRRTTNMSRTTWKLYTYPSIEKAEGAAKRYVTGSAVLRGAPILVQLEPVDIGAIADKKMPGARYRGNTTHEALFGKLEDGAKVTPIQMSATGFDAVKLLDAAKVPPKRDAGTTPPIPKSSAGEPY